MSYQVLNLNVQAILTPSRGNAVLHVRESRIQPQSAALSFDTVEQKVVQLNSPESQDFVNPNSGRTPSDSTETQKFGACSQTLQGSLVN